jgi:NAD kinase
VVLTVDGELLANLESSDLVVIRASDSVSRFVRLRDRNYFYRSLLDRLEPRVPGRSRQRRVGEPTESSQNQ